MSYWVLDAEADGLLDEVTKIHCICLKEFGQDNWAEFTIDSKIGFSEWTKFTKEIDGLIGHNTIGYDFPLFNKLLGIDYSIQPDMFNDQSIQIIDTLVMSRELNPDRLLPRGCPEAVLNPVTGKKDMVGPHGLMAWSYRVNGRKPIIYNWIDQAIEIYVERCREDVMTTEKVFIELMKEAELKI